MDEQTNEPELSSGLPRLTLTPVLGRGSVIRRVIRHESGKIKLSCQRRSKQASETINAMSMTPLTPGFQIENPETTAVETARLSETVLLTYLTGRTQLKAWK